MRKLIIVWEDIVGLIVVVFGVLIKILKMGLILVLIIWIRIREGIGMGMRIGMGIC